MIKEITVKWEGPISPDEVMRERHDLGLYQIYGPHELYSNKKRPTIGNCIDKVLLYIGMTLTSGFSARIVKQGFCHNSPNYEIYLGHIEGNEYDNDVKSWKCDVEDAEILSINKYAPPYNAQYVGDIHRAQLNNQECVIINLESKADLDETIKSREVVQYE